MASITVLFILLGCISVNARYSLYSTDIRFDSSRTFDCLYAYVIEGGKEMSKPYIRNYHLIPYCRRPDDNEDVSTVNGNIAQTISFNDLRKQGVTSEQLLQWFAPIDIAEKYQMNTNDFEVFHNCSSPWFGSMCEYRLQAYDSSMSFGEIVQITFSNPNKKRLNVTTGTCYRFLTGCSKEEVWPTCLDWREICDGKFDCINGEDEKWCDQLETTDCADDEYRCHYGGQCIPLTFAKDSRLSIDCLDGSDEVDIRSHSTLLMNEHCAGVTTFQCQERIARNQGYFSCGDGQYLLLEFMPDIPSYCANNRDKELSRSMLTSMDHITNITCRQSFYCALHYNRILATDVEMSGGNTELFVLLNDTWDKECEPLSESCSSEWLVIPSHPRLFGYFQFVYFTNRSVDEFKKNVAPDLVCFSAQRCPKILASIVPIALIDGLICSHTFNLIGVTKMKNFLHILTSFSPLQLECSKKGNENSCLNSSYFHCSRSSKCISYRHVGDGKKDCFYNEDELTDACQLNDSNRYRCLSKPNQCLMPVTIGNSFYDCSDAHDEIFSYTWRSMNLVPFPQICNYEYDYPYVPNKDKDDDESNCDWWPCLNPYTRCDERWNCPLGTDELNCPNSRCSFNEYECRNERLNLSYCLPKVHLYDKYLSNNICNGRQWYFYNGTKNISEDYLSWKNIECPTSNILCRHVQTSQDEQQPCLYLARKSLFLSNPSIIYTQNNEYLCELRTGRKSPTNGNVFVKATRFGYFPSISTNRYISKINPKNQIRNPIADELSLYCHRGILVFNGRNESKQCLCPPNYFGHQCQWQNQRISLSLQLFWRTTASISVIFEVMIMLIDEYEYKLHDHEQLTYMPSRDCNTKFHLYLLYRDRWKNLSRNYSIRIDLYEKIHLSYWASWYLPISFLFLPVNRIATQLIIPEVQQQSTCDFPCGEHGRCRNYINTNISFFCQCDQGYSGTYCHLTHPCNCANGSICLHSSICLCPLHQFGVHCYLNYSICHSSRNPCEHQGICVPNDHRMNSIGYTCFCPEDYSGEQCQNRNTQIDIQFDQTLVTKTPLLLLHFITVFDHNEHEKIAVLKKIPYDHHRNLTVYVVQPFNILFIQPLNRYDYYLAILRETFQPSEHIYTTIQGKQRCLSIEELLNATLVQSDYLRRVKFYPRLCREYSQLMCFYDYDFMCLCDLDRFSNCFLFNHTMMNTCQGANPCENNGQCFENNATCPTRSVCICEDCYYGGKCQFSTSSFTFSLDSILAYHIKPRVSLDRQPVIIRVSIAISTVMFIAGLISGLLSIVTFRREKIRQVGTGNYLFISSVTSMVMIIILTMKFWTLIHSQISLSTNRAILQLNCMSMDFLLKMLLASSEWFNACVAIERMISILQSTRFNQKKSKQISKWIILIVFLLTILTHIHDPLHRQLIDDFDIDEQRIWCFVRYSSSLNIYNSFINLFHFLLPFTINLLSAIWIILLLARNRAGVQPNQTYREHFKRQMDQHQHLLITPCLLIVLCLPRLIISFLSGCMRSTRQPWLYLCAYFLSFISSMLTFVIFVLPSKHYKREFHTVLQQTIRRFR